MKTKKIEKWLLLEQSGELSSRQLDRLGRELNTSADARAMRKELDHLKEGIITPDVEPAPWTVTRIAARLCAERHPGLDLLKVWKPVLALAACLMLVMDIFNFHGKQPTIASTAVVSAAGADLWDDPLEKDLNSLENLIVAISDEPLDVVEM